MRNVKLKKPKTPTPNTGDAQITESCHGPIGDLIHEVENLSREQSLARISDLQAKIDHSYFYLGGVLSQVKKNEWYKPHKNIGEFVEASYGFGEKKARYLIEI